jgi:hypothetical protein
MYAMQASLLWKYSAKVRSANCPDDEEVGKWHAGIEIDEDQRKGRQEGREKRGRNGQTPRWSIPAAGLTRISAWCGRHFLLFSKCEGKNI